MSVLMRQISSLSPMQTLLSRSYTTFTASPCLAVQSTVNFQARHASKKKNKFSRYIYDSRVFRSIRGGGRPVPEGVTVPVGKVYGFRIIYPEDGKYTTKPLPIMKLGGRDPKTGRVVVRTIGGGFKKSTFWVDNKRTGPDDGSVLEEKVFKIERDDCRTAHFALVASGDRKRWITASEHMKVGDIIKSCSNIPRLPVRPEDGHAYAVGALPQGSVIHNIECKPKAGGLFCRAAGSSGQVLRKIDNKCLVQLPSKQQILIDEKCTVVSGKVSNTIHSSIPIGTPNRMRWLGKRQNSGLWHRKDGYCGRKIYPPKPIKDLLLEREPEPEIYELSYPD